MAGVDSLAGPGPQVNRHPYQGGPSRGSVPASHSRGSALTLGPGEVRADGHWDRLPRPSEGSHTERERRLCSGPASVSPARGPSTRRPLLLAALACLARLAGTLQNPRGRRCCRQAVGSFTASWT